MDPTEAIAVIILIIAIIVLVYYYLLNSPGTIDKLRQYVPTSGDAHMEEVLGSSPAELTEAAPKDKDSESVTKRIKVK